MAGRGWHHRGYIPHFDANEVIQHVVFRLADSLPMEVMRATEKLDAPRRWRSLEAALGQGRGSALLRDPIAAQIVADAVTWFDGDRYRLYVWCVMPTHVHVIVEPIGGRELGAIVRSWKAYSAATINRATGRSGRLWAADYFDRYMRTQEQFSTTIAYVENNPVAAGLCAAPGDWRFSSAFQSETAAPEERA